MADDTDDHSPAPEDPRVIAMLGALFGQDWRDKLNTDVVFERGKMETWIYAVETMLNAADAADPLRVAIRSLVQEAHPSSRSGSSLPTAS